jgi:hypothetical protein
MGAEAFRQVRSDTVYEADQGPVTCADAGEQTLHNAARPVRDEEHWNPLDDLPQLVISLRVPNVREPP